MKKLIMLCIAGSAFLIMSCQQKKPTDTANVSKPAPVATAKDTVNFEIDSATVQGYVSNYAPYAGFTPNNSMPNTRCVWLSLARLKYLVAKLESEQSTQNTDGLRVYFCRYPKGESDGQGTDLSYYNTLGFVSTKQDIKIIGKDTIIIHKDYFSPKEHVTMIPPENKGEICPPPADCCDAGATLLCKPPASQSLKK